MLNIKRGLVLLSGAMVLTGCEIISIAPDRVEESSGATITVSDEGTFGGGECVDEEVRIFYIDEETSDRVDLGSGTAGAAGEDWSIEVPAPTERGSYHIQAECDSASTSVNVEELVVQPPFAPVVDPAGYVVGFGPETITVTGEFCINSEPVIDGPPISSLDVQVIEEDEELPLSIPLPTVTGVLGADMQTAVATVNQPFDETWSLEFAAPTTPGEHVIDIGCTFFDYLSGAVFGGIIDGLPGEGFPGDITAFDTHDTPELPPFITEETSAALLSVQVDGILELDDTDVDEGDSVTATNAESSPCAGTVTARLLDGDTVASAAPTVAEDGSWSATFDDLAPGAYSVVADCVGAEDAGTFSYEPVVLSVAGVQPTTTTTTTTSAPTGQVASDSATPVRAQPAFTG